MWIKPKKKVIMQKWNEFVCFTGTVVSYCFLMAFSTAVASKAEKLFRRCSLHLLFLWKPVLLSRCFATDLLRGKAEVLPVLLHYSARFPLPFCISWKTHYFHKCLKIPIYLHWVLPCLFKADGGQLRFGLPSWIWFFQGSVLWPSCQTTKMACLLLLLLF